MPAGFPHDTSAYMAESFNAEPGIPGFIVAGNITHHHDLHEEGENDYDATDFQAPPGAKFGVAIILLSVNVVAHTAAYDRPGLRLTINVYRQEAS